MAEAAAQPARRRRSTPEDASWSQVWHLPVLLLGLGLFVLGMWLSLPEQQPNDFPGALDEVAQYLAAENVEDAQAALNEILPHIEQADAVQQARHWQYWGDLTFLQLRHQPEEVRQTPSAREAYERVVQYYDRAEQLGRAADGSVARPLDHAAIRRYAEALVALDRGDEALAMLGRLEDAPAHERYRIIKQLIERHRDAGAARHLEELARLLERFNDEIRLETDPDERRKQEIWSAATAAEIQLAAGDPQGAIDALLVRIQRLNASRVDARDLAPLRVLLAKAYQRIGELEMAERLYLAAQQQLDPSDGLNADILVGLGQIALIDHGDMSVQRALEFFSHATRNYQGERAYIDALIGQADCEARLQAYGDAIEHFQLAVERLVASSRKWDPRRERITEVVRSHIQRAVDQERYDLSLDFLTLLAPLHQPELPPELLLDFAITHEKIAEQRRQYALQELGPDGAGPSPDARRLANQQAAMHYQQAGDYYQQHADAVTIVDNEGHGESLWKAATCYDAAENWKRAIEVYAEYVATRQTDPRRLEAVLRLGKAYLADGQYPVAVEQFLRLLADHPHSLEAYEALVPLARAYLAMGENDKAERTLLSVVTDHEAITPESQQYREGLIELGKLYYRLGEQNPEYYVNAIERLTEAVERYGQTREGPTLRFLLADSYRRSVSVLDEQLTERQSQADRLALQSERNRRLEQAQMYYNQVLTELEARDSALLSPLEQLYLRNSYFYQADCAFDRRQYELAIELYDVAARRWKEHPASLVALVQIVNAHCELGQFQEARVANERARSQLSRMPDEAFEDPTLPMSREHWEDWLRWTSEVELFGTGGNGTLSRG